MTTSDEAIPTEAQPTKPCHDCPFARGAINGWLGGNTKEEWSAMVMGEAAIPCHALEGPQCAGAAIMRGNMCKRPRDRSLLVLPPDRARVFADTREFEEHHGKLEGIVQAKAGGDARAAVLALLDDLIAPGRMAAEDAFAVLTDLQDDVDGRAAALHEDMARSPKPKRRR